MIDSPLNNLLREFRAEFIKLSHEEIVFNPQHLINIFALYNTFYARVEATDQNGMKRNFFWDHLVEFAMCDLPAAKAQIFANPGLYDTVENGAKNLRVFDYKYGGGSIFPPLVSPIDPHNKKLRGGWGNWRTSGRPSQSARFKTYVGQQHQAFRTYYAAAISARCAPVCNSVM